MAEQDNQADIPVLQRDRQNQREEFIAAMMIEARNINAQIQVFQDLLNDAPPLSVEALFDLTSRFLGKETNFVQLLLEHEPKVARHKDRHGLLLHRAIRFPASSDMIELILDAYPEGIYEKYSNGLLPLHFAFQMREDCVQTLELLLSRYPGAAGVSPVGWYGQFPLHHCLRRIEINMSDDFALNLIEAYPDAASIDTGVNETALHLACGSGFSLAVIHRLYELYPEAVTVQNGYLREILLHSVCRLDIPNVEVVKFLLEEHPEGAQSSDRIGQLPLHSSCTIRDASLGVVQVLIDSYPDAVNITDNYGRLPLHSACNNGASLEVIQLLLNRFVGDDRHHNGLSIKDNAGFLPIHYYARLAFNARPETLQYLLGLCPGSIHAADGAGRLPLHWACGSLIPPALEVIRLLIEAAPFTVIQKSLSGKTPIQHDWGLRYEDVEMLEYLLDRQNEALNAMKETFADIADVQLGLPDLVVANVWSFAKPDLWTPREEEWDELVDFTRLDEVRHVYILEK